jgi:hypothetical protein
MRRKPRRNRDLTHEDWAALYARVIALDLRIVIAEITSRGLKASSIHRRGHTEVWITGTKIHVCPAAIIDRSQWGTCSGPWHLDHVQDPSQPMKGKKAPDDEQHLLSLCATHDERGMKGGHVWNTANREGEWRYLREHRSEGDRPGE